MGHFFGVVGQPPFTVGETSFLIPGNNYAYRRSDEYFMGRNVQPSMAPIEGFELGEATDEDENGTIRTIVFTRATSDNGYTPNALWGSMIGQIQEDDPRVTYSLGSVISTADFLPEIPTRRFTDTGILVESPTNLVPYDSTLWDFKAPLPMLFRFLFEDDIYTVGAAIRFVGAGESFTYVGRFVHGLPTYAGGALSQCAVDGAIFSSLEEEVAHNSLSFQMGEGAVSTTFNRTYSELSFPSTTTDGELPYVSNSEVGGADSGRVYFPAIVRLDATFVEPGRLRVDGTSTISPSATVIGFLIRGGNGFFGGITSGSIDHYEVNGVTIEPGATPLGEYMPGTVFDIVFSDDGSAFNGYLTVSAVIECEAIPANTTPLEEGTYPFELIAPERHNLFLNAMMSIPAFLELTVQPRGADEGMIVRPSGQIQTRAGSQLWQHRGEARYFAGELASGDVFARDDEEGEWNSMSNAWTGVSGARVLGFASLPFKAAVSIAKVGNDVKSRYSKDGIIWQTPVTVCPYAAGKWAIASHEYSGSDAISVRNNTTEAHYKSTNRGRNWQEVTG